MAPIYKVDMTQKQAEGFKKFGLNPVEYKPEISKPTIADIVKSDYIKLGIKNIEKNFDENKGFNIAINPTEQNQNWEQQNISLLEKGLDMSIPKEFMAFYNSVLYAYQNNKPLFDAGGNEVKRDVVEQLYNNLTSKEWTNLNMRFEENNNGIWTIKEAVGLDENKNLIYNEKRISVPISEGCYVNPKVLTTDGIPRKKLKNQSFKRGENIYFWSPVKGRVVGFFADVDRAILSCGWSPSDRDSILGVRAVRHE